MDSMRRDASGTMQASAVTGDETLPKAERKRLQIEHASHPSRAARVARSRLRSASAKTPFFTIGHSNRSLEEFVELLKRAQIELVADIRKVPGSRANPQFNGDALRKTLAAAGISYEHIAALGGLRTKSRTLSKDLNGFWTNTSFHNYADYALTAEFHAGLDHLLAAGHRQRCTMMCSEAVWWRCHRRIVTDYLIASGETVLHIMGPGRFAPASLTVGALIQSGGHVVYPAAHASGDR